MPSPEPLFSDPLSPSVPAAEQISGAQLVQKLFTQIFRAAASGASDGAAYAADLQQCLDWVHRANPGAPQDHALNEQCARLALLLSGLDQWGLAFSQAFQITAIPALSALIGELRSALDPQAEAIFLRHFDQIHAEAAYGLDFKIHLRRQIHLALWHAMGSSASANEAAPIIQALGSQLLALQHQMPQLGERLVADALAHIQLRLLQDPQASSQSQLGTQQLLAALRAAMPPETYRRIMALATQAIVGA